MINRRFFSEWLSQFLDMFLSHVTLVWTMKEMYLFNFTDIHWLLIYECNFYSYLLLNYFSTGRIHLLAEKLTNGKTFLTPFFPFSWFDNQKGTAWEAH